MTTKIELWMEGETVHLRVHASESETFGKVKRDLEAMRDRLTAEIKNGAKLCPYSRKDVEPARVEKRYEN